MWFSLWSFMLLPLIFFNLNFYKMTSFSLMFNNISFLFLLSLMLIFKNIIFFKKIYMKNSIYFQFLMYVFLFNMVILIISNSFMLILISWEGLGVSSYLLVLFYYNWNSIQGSYLTMVSNRFGDMFLMSSLLMMSLKFSLMLWVVILMMAITKSAQIPFMSWLPAAMAAPTPVSALVHSSTLVTAGVYMCYKFLMPCYFMFSKELLMGFGLLTMFSGSISALMSSDIKKMVAFSTLSQLGFMFMIFCSMWIGLGIFHLLIHAFLKSFMFMMIGLLMMKMNSQSIFSSSYLLKSYSFTTLYMMIFLNFCSFIFSSMFFSKELSLIFMTPNMIYMKSFIFMILLLTLTYMLRLTNLLVNFFNPFKMSIINKLHMVKLKLNYFMVINLMGLVWMLNMIKFNLSLTMWSLLMMLILLISIIKMKFINLFKIFLLINMMCNMFSLKIMFMVKEESILLNIFFLNFLKMKVVNWNLMMFITLILFL